MTYWYLPFSYAMVLFAAYVSAAANTYAGKPSTVPELNWWLMGSLMALAVLLDVGTIVFQKLWGESYG